MHFRTVFFLFLFSPTLFIAQKALPSDQVFGHDYVEIIDMPQQNNKILRQQELAQRTIGRPNTFAVSIDVKINPKANGTWESVKSGTLIWRQRIISKNAHSINLGFNKFKLPSSANLFIYNPEKTDILGPFTKADNDDHLQFWTPIIKGDEIVIELQISEADLDNYQLELQKVNHDFMGVFESLLSGSCNIDVACGAADGFPQIDEYRDIISSVGAYTLNGIDQCSGVLINTTKNDCTPYFLTAEHCGVSNSNGAGVVVYWNYENSYCRLPNTAESGQTGDGPKTDFNSGASEVSEFENSDMSLLLLDDPIRPESGLYAAGWSRINETPDNTIAIHHPGVEEKRISFDNDPPVWAHPDLPNINILGDTSYVIINDWDLGTTEGGSSGSPLFNPDHLVIGQLFGGLAACGNDSYDYYGWMGKSWEGGGTPETQLKAWLDPDDSGVMFIRGHNCNAFIDIDRTTEEICSSTTDTLMFNFSSGGSFDSTIYYRLENFPNILNANFSKDSSQLSDNIVLTIDNLSSLPDTTLNIILVAFDNSLESKININIIVRNTPPLSPLLVYPDDNSENVATTVLFNWNSDQSTIYTFQLSTDQDFSTLLTDTEIDENTFLQTSLEQEISYFWRVRSNNACGDSPWSETYTFKVGNKICVNYIVQDLPLIITEESGTFDHGFEVDFDVLVADLVINKISGVHSWVGDLIVSLGNPQNDQSILFQEICEDEDDFDLGFDDSSLLGNITCPPTDKNIYKPFESLNKITNTSSQGTWNLKVVDTQFFDGGSVDSLNIDFCFYSNPNPTLVPLKNYYEFCQNEEIKFDIYFFDLALSEFDIVNNDILIANVREQDPTVPDRASINLLDIDQLNIGLNNIRLESDEFSIGLNIVISPIPTEVDLIFPSTMEKIAPNLFNRLEWSDDNVNDNYLVDIAKDESFNDIIFSNNLSQNQLILPAIFDEDTKYYIRITALNRCGEKTSSFVVETDKISSSQTIDEGDLEIYPNPVSNQLFIKNIGNRKIEMIELYASDGRAIQINSNSQNGMNQIDLSNIDPGLYVLVLLIDNKRVLRKIIIE